MGLKIGQTITCIKEITLYGSQCTTIGKPYEIKTITEFGIEIRDDQDDLYFFSFDKRENTPRFSEYFTTEAPQKERYFIVFYFFLDKEKNGHGFCGIVTNDGGYLNRDETLKEIKEQNEQAVLTNIIELNQQDYESWNK